MSITRKSQFNLTEEQYYKLFPDTNCNDKIEMVIKVNDKVYSKTNYNVNTQDEFYQQQTYFMEVIESLKLTLLSKFGS